MFPPDDTDFNTSTGPIDSSALDRSAHVAYHREMINEKRQRHTDMLPKLNAEISNGKTTTRQVTHLREENRRFRLRIDELQGLIYEYRQTQAQLERELDSLQSNKQNEIEQYEIHLREAIEERNQLEATNQELKKQYQDLDHSFHEKVSEEAKKMVTEAANTIILTPEHTPPLLRDVAKTVELHTKQTEDQHVAELLSLIRQAQYKADLLELELATEREKIAAERQNLLDQQSRISEHAQYRYTTMQQHVRAHWTVALTLMAASLLILVPILQLVFVSMKVPLDIAIFFPVLICIGLAFLIARAYTDNKLRNAHKKLEQKPGAKQTKTLTSPPKKE
jgi:DNA repair exonuclease SbcCD ATPase subunit